MTNWNRRFLGLAEYVAGWSKDPSTKVGAVIVDQQRIILALGYNGFPRGIYDRCERLTDRDTKLRLTVHAEINALHNASASVRGATLYTWPLSPCSACALQIIQAGIARVVAPYAGAELFDRWRDALTDADDLFREAGVHLDLVRHRGPCDED